MKSLIAKVQFTAKEIHDVQDCCLLFYDDGTYTSSMDVYQSLSYWKIEDGLLGWKRDNNSEWININTDSRSLYRVMAEKIVNTIKAEQEFQKALLGEASESR